MALSAEEIAHVKSHCPCGARVELEEMTLREGQMSAVIDGEWRALPMREIERHTAPGYHHRATMRFFCSAACSSTWHEIFWRPYQQHIGASA